MCENAKSETSDELTERLARELAVNISEGTRTVIFTALESFDKQLFRGNDLPEDNYIKALLELSKIAVMSLALVKKIDLGIIYTFITTKTTMVISRRLWMINDTEDNMDQTCTKDYVLAVAESVFREVLVDANLTRKSHVLAMHIYKEARDKVTLPEQVGFTEALDSNCLVNTER